MHCCLCRLSPLWTHPEIVFFFQFCDSDNKSVTGMFFYSLMEMKYDWDLLCCWWDPHLPELHLQRYLFSSYKERNELPLTNRPHRHRKYCFAHFVWHHRIIWSPLAVRCPWANFRIWIIDKSELDSVPYASTMDNISTSSRGSVGSLSEPVKIRCSYMRTARERMRFGLFGPPRRVYKVGNNLLVAFY